MDHPEPIVILGMARTGTSMTSGIFHHHGVWVGKCNPPSDQNPKGFFENKAVKKLLKKTYGIDLREIKEPIPGFRAEVEAILNSEGYEGGPWLVKHSAVYYKAWNEFNPLFVKVRRPVEATFESTRQLHVSRYTDEERKHIIDLHEKAMDSVPGPDVFTQDIVLGDYSSLKRAIEYCGLEYNEKIVEDFVDKKHWHHWKRNADGTPARS